MFLVRPPLKSTVNVTIIDVVVKINCLASVEEFLIAKIAKQFQINFL